jgi:hypothetical protein
MRKLFHASLVLVISLSLPIFGFAQKDILVPYRLGEKFGISDLKGKILLKPQFDLIEPIGGGYFKYSNHKIFMDSATDYYGKTKVRERVESVRGLLKGNNVIIRNSEHRHFTYVENALLIGSQESYVSTNSNFYTLNGKRLLNENVERFRILANHAYEYSHNEDAPFITLYVEHYDRKTSLLIFDVVNQKLIEPLLNRVSELTLDRDESTESYLVCSYYDDNFQHYKDRIYYNDSLKRHVKEPYTSRRTPAYDCYYGGNVEEGEAEVPFDAPEGMITGGYGTGTGSVSEGAIEYVLPDAPAVPVRKKTFSFQKVNDTVVKYGEASITLPQGQKILFGDKYSSSQRQPLIYTDGSKYGLLFSDSVRSELEYDTLRYIKHNSRYLYLTGKKTLENNKWKMGVLNESGEVFIPLMYEQVIPGILELEYSREDSPDKSAFYLKQTNSYNKDKNQPLSMYGASFTVSQNGKMGLVDFSNKTLLPIEYDSLWKNGLSFLTTLRADDDFYVYKKDGKYGLFNLNYKNEIRFETQAVFPMIPVCRYRNYAGIKDFDLIQLATEQSLYFCYAGSDGTIYYNK